MWAVRDAVQQMRLLVSWQFYENTLLRCEAAAGTEISAQLPAMWLEELGLIFESEATVGSLLFSRHTFHHLCSYKVQIQLLSQTCHNKAKRKII